MTVEEAIAARLAELATVQAIVGSRVYLDTLPQGGAFPAVRVVLIDVVTRYHLRGVHGLQRARVQVDAVVQDVSGRDAYADVAALADAIDGDSRGPDASGLSGWIGRVGSPPLTIRGCFRTSRLRRYDPDELQLLTMSQDYFVDYVVA